MPFASDFDSSLDIVTSSPDFAALSVPGPDAPDALSEAEPEDEPVEDPDASAGALPPCVEGLPGTPFGSIFASSFSGAAGLSWAWA
jgi:hypothetical protein